MQDAINRVEELYAELAKEKDFQKRAFIYGKIEVATANLISHAKAITNAKK